MPRLADGSLPALCHVVDYTGTGSTALPASPAGSASQQVARAPERQPGGPATESPTVPTIEG